MLSARSRMTANHHRSPHRTIGIQGDEITTLPSGRLKLRSKGAENVGGRRAEREVTGTHYSGRRMSRLLFSGGGNLNRWYHNAWRMRRSKRNPLGVREALRRTARFEPVFSYKVFAIDWLWRRVSCEKLFEVLTKIKNALSIYSKYVKSNGNHL